MHQIKKIALNYPINIIIFAAATGPAPTLYNETKWFYSLIPCSPHLGRSHASKWKLDWPVIMQPSKWKSAERTQEIMFFILQILPQFIHHTHRVHTANFPTHEDPEWGDEFYLSYPGGLNGANMRSDSDTWVTSSGVMLSRVMITEVRKTHGESRWIKSSLFMLIQVLSRHAELIHVKSCWFASRWMESCWVQ